MIRAVWKFPLEQVPAQVIEIPAGSELLSIEVQNGIPCIYALVDPKEKNKKLIWIDVVGTGDQIVIESGMRFMKTVMLHNGDAVFHIFVKE